MVKVIPTEFVDSWAESCFRKVNLTDAQNYDVITFKSSKTNLIIHFGLFLQPTKMLHIEEGVSHVYKQYHQNGGSVYTHSIDMTKWYDKYVGFPFKHLGDDPTKGIDCVNLLRLVFKQELHIHVLLRPMTFVTL